MKNLGSAHHPSLDVLAFCRAGDNLSGAWPLVQMQRLAASLDGAPAADAVAAWSAKGLLRPVAGGQPEVWLHLQGAAAVTLQCQRCLRAMTEDLAVDRHFRFVRHEDEAARLDEEIEDDVMVLPTRLDLTELLEDELILALPIVPRHSGVCPDPLPLRADKGLKEASAPHAFAALAALRGHTGGGTSGGDDGSTGA
jgi:uncharacterized protein